VHTSVVHVLLSPQSAPVRHATHELAPLPPVTQYGVAIMQPRSTAEPGRLLMHGSHTGEPVPVVRQCGAAFMQPASVPMADVSVQVTHVLVGAPEHTWPPVQLPVPPTATAVLTHALAVQASVVQATLSLQCAAVVHGTH
jgi:hypothetical protein